jgi:hypothetical protein
MDDSLEQMVADGSLVEAGIDENGDTLYQMVPEKCQELHPNVWKEQYSHFLSNVNELWQAGYIDVSFTNDDVEISLNARSIAPGDDLDSSMKHVLSEVVVAVASAEN